MRPWTSLALLACALVLTACGQGTGDTLSWAYPKGPQTPFPQPSPGPHTVPGGTRTLTADQIMDEANPPDWNPEQHPPAPAIVAHGRKDGPIPCASCHLLNGQGFQGAPNLNGLSAAYIVEQVREFREGRRRSFQHGRPDTEEMIKVARKTTDPEALEAARYYAALPRAPWYRVVETAKAPKTRPNFYGWLDLVPGGGTERIGNRLIEVPEDPARTYLSDPRSGLVVYAPPGAVKRGEALVKSGGFAGIPCATCHGADLRGVGDVPPLAGRSAAYLTRMLWDIKTGARSGPTIFPMGIVASDLTEQDITNMAAYLASLKP